MRDLRQPLKTYAYLYSTLNLMLRLQWPRMNESVPTEGNTSSRSHSLDVPIIQQQVAFAQEIFRFSVVAVGMCLNLIVLLVVSCSRQLRYPRHIFWAAVLLIDILFLSECVLELAVVVYHDRLACRFFVLLAGVDYSALLLCLTLAALDRYLAITRYDWYKKKVTIRRVVLLLSGSSGLTFVAVTSPFWSGYKSIYSCTISMTQMHWIFIWDLLLGLICVILHGMIFVKSRAIIRQSQFSYSNQQPITLRFVNSFRPSGVNSPGEYGAEDSPARISAVYPIENPPVAINDGNSNALDDTRPADHPPSSIDHAFNGNECFLWMRGRSKINRMEVRAALSMSINILPFWLCTFPVSCQSIALYWCIQLGSDCYSIYHMSFYLRDLFMVHSIYNPVMYMLTSNEFRRAIHHIAWKLKNEFRIR